MEEEDRNHVGKVKEGEKQSNKSCTYAQNADSKTQLGNNVIMSTSQQIVEETVSKIGDKGVASNQYEELIKRLLDEKQEWKNKFEKSNKEVSQLKEKIKKDCEESICKYEIIIKLIEILSMWVKSGTISVENSISLEHMLTTSVQP